MKEVLLYSGGMDSVMLSYLHPRSELVYINTGTRYSEREMRNLPGIVNIIDQTFLADFEQRDDIIPTRNAYFVLAAANFGEKIILGAMLGDLSKDKDHIFCSLMETLLNYTWQPQGWTEGKKLRVVAPYKNMTKTELVDLYLDSGFHVEPLLKSYSCYTGNDRHCGQCKPCFRKWVAFENNNIKTPDGYFEHNPWEWDWVKDNIKLIKNKQHRGGVEDEETISALTLVGVL